MKKPDSTTAKRTAGNPESYSQPSPVAVVSPSEVLHMVRSAHLSGVRFRFWMSFALV
jgi:hypothetical protein